MREYCNYAHAAPSLHRACAVSAIAICAFFTAHAVEAADIYSDGPLDIRWDNTIKYSVGVATENADPHLASPQQNLNGTAGNAFKSGDLITNRGDLLTELDVKYGDAGLRASAAAWYDTVYNGTNNNTAPNQVSWDSVPPNKYPGPAKAQEGKMAELLDAFVYDSGTVAGVPVSVRMGRHTLIWGESLFLASNGIAYGQAPINADKALGVPNTQAKELFMPVGQLSATIRPSSAFSIEAYFQPEWRPTRTPASGSFYNTAADWMGAGGDRFMLSPGFAPNNPATNFLYLQRQKDIDAQNLHQGGLAVRYHSEEIDTDFGLYALNFNDKNAQTYLKILPNGGPSLVSPFPGVVVPTGLLGRLGDYQLVYGKDIQTVGASASTQVGDWNVAGEMSFRHNMPLLSGTEGVMLAPASAGNNGNHAYATGDTLHEQVSGILALTPTPLWEGGTVLAEIGAHQRLAYTSNEAAADPDRTSYAVGARLLFTPTYFQVAPGVDVSLPIGVGYTLGKSPVDAAFNNGAEDHSGDVSIGVAADLDKTWFCSINFTHYFGAPDAFHQWLAGHDFVVASVKRTF